MSFSTLRNVKRQPQWNPRREVHLPSPNGKNLFLDDMNEPPLIPDDSDLVRHLREIDLPISDAMDVFVFAQTLLERLNQYADGPEAEYIRPAHNRGLRRYESLFRRHGHTITIIDTYAERGIEVVVKIDEPVDDTVTTIIRQQLLDFARGNLNGGITVGRIMSRIGNQLADPKNGLTLPGQNPRPFNLRMTKYNGFIAVEDTRKKPSRRGDPSPRYWLDLAWLTGNFNPAQYVRSCSNTYDHIRDSLYKAIPTIVDAVNIHRGEDCPGNRFIISMNEPEIWTIEDHVLRKSFYLWNHSALNPSFNITNWYRWEAAIQDYSAPQYEQILGTYMNVSEEQGTQPSSTPPTTPTSGTFFATKSSSRLANDTKQRDGYESEGEPSEESEVEIINELRRSPRPYAYGKTRQHSPVNLKSR